MSPPATGAAPAGRGIYVHVPFCARKCAYCDFFSVVADPGSMDAFCRLLVREAEIFRKARPEDAAAPADTIFFGGGTPTTLGPGRLRGLLDALRSLLPVGDAAEISVEANPGTVSADDLSALADAGFNRVSIGVQSFDPATLSTLGRVHDAESARRALREARSRTGMSVGVDLIFGIPGQTAASWSSDLAAAIELRPDHVSAYALAPEAGTPLQAAVARGELCMPPGDDVADMYEEARRALSAAGFQQYEISNFARPGHECRHNMKYWERTGYAGLGPSAHGLLFPPAARPFGERTANPKSLGDYARAIGDGRPAWAEVLACDAADAWTESLIAGLRLADGVDVAEIEKRYGPPPAPVRGAVDALVGAARLVREGSRLRMPPELFFVSNEVLSRLV